MKRVCVFCGSSPGVSPRYAAAAAALGHELAERGLGLVYGGGRLGLMGVVADAALEKGGEVVGVIPEDLVKKEVAHRGLTKLHVVGSMHERKALMEKLSDAFIALPGGFGTLDEFCEILTWAQLGFHRKPCGLLDVDEYFKSFRAFVAHSTSQGFIRPEHQALLVEGAVPGELLERFSAYKPVEIIQWPMVP